VRRLAAALAALAALAAGAQEHGTARWYLQVDNDVILDGDRWYTSGVRIARVAGEGPRRTEWGLLQEIYTPEAARWAPGVDDRAPAARLLAYRAWHTVGPGALDTIELAVGVRGPAARGKESTDAIHEVVPAPYVDWSRQEGDQVDASIAGVRSRPLSVFHVHYGAVVGTEVIHAHGGIEMRFGPAAARAAFSPAMRFAATPPADAGPAGWAAFVGANVRAVLHNDMLSRNYDAFGPAIERRKGVARGLAGVVATWSWGSVSATAVYESREFEQQREAQAWGSFIVHLEF
jgi:hypothetical protein